jgi:hypothetical protein
MKQVYPYFNRFNNTRMARAQPHPLINIITIAMCSVICGADNFVTMTEFGHSKNSWFETFLVIPHGVPSHDTFNDVINRLVQSASVKCFTQWIKQLAVKGENVIALGGKILRRTGGKINSSKAIWFVNA